MKRLLTIIPILWLLSIAYTLDLLGDTYGLTATGLLIATVVIIGLKYMRRAWGLSATIGISFLGYAILLILGYTGKIVPTHVWTGEFLVFSALTALIVAAWDSLNRLNIKELLPQIFIMFGITAALYGVRLDYVLISLAIAIALTENVRAFIGVLLSWSFLMLPLAGMPATVENIGELPHIIVPMYPTGSASYTPAVLMYYTVSLMLTAVLGGINAGVWRTRRGTPSTYGEIALRSIGHSIMPVVFYAGLGGAWYFLGATETYYSFLTPALISWGIALSATFIRDYLLYLNKVRSIRREIDKKMSLAETHLKHIKEAFNRLKEFGVETNSLNIVMAQTKSATSLFQSITKELRNSGGNYEKLTVVNEDLDELLTQIKAIDTAVIDIYKKAFNLIQQSYPLIKTLKIRIPISTDELKILSEAKTAEDIVIKSDSLINVGKQICDLLEKTLGESIEYYAKLLNKPIKYEKGTCKKWRSPFRAISALLDGYTTLIEPYEKEVLGLYNILVELKHSITNQFQNMDKKWRNLILQTNPWLNNLLEELEELSEVPPLPHEIPKIVLKEATSLSEVVPSIIKETRRQYEMTKADLGYYLSKGVRGVELSLEDLESRIKRLEQDQKVLALVAEKPKEFIRTLKTKLPTMVSNISNILIESYELRTKAQLIPMVLDYIDWALQHNGGKVNLSKLPFSENALIWFLKLYIMSRENVIVEGDTLKTLQGRGVLA